jgi:hypothetical protein
MEKQNMTTNTHRHTARPSRSRVILARVAGALNRAMDYGDRHLTALTVILGTLAAVALALLVAFDDNRAAVAVVSVAVCAFVAFVTFAATSDAAITAYAKAHRASVARIVAKHDAAREEWHKYCDQMTTRYEEQNARNIARRNDALDDRDLALREMRNAQRECDRMTRELATSGERMAASYDITKVERDALESENANLVALIRALISPTFADATREELRVWIWAGNSESAYADAFYNGEGVSLDDEITRRAAYEMAERANARK